MDQGWSPDGQWIVYQRPYGVLTLVHPDEATARMEQRRASA